MQDVQSLKRGEKKIFLCRPAHHDETPKRFSLVRLTTEDDKQGKAACDHGRRSLFTVPIREKGGDALGRCTMMEARSLRNGTRVSIVRNRPYGPSLTEAVTAAHIS
ncbi:hypothetical protein V8C37DRAFT_413412 [Trichoderma ceciliae]